MEKPEYILHDLDFEAHVNPDGSLWHEWQRDGSFLSNWEMNFSFYSCRSEAISYAKKLKIKRFQVKTVKQYLGNTNK